MAAAQTFNYQSFYIEELQILNDDLEYYKTLRVDDYQKPIIYNGLYKLAWDYFALQQNTTHNVAVYNVALVAGFAAIAAGDLRLPVVINTAAEFAEAMNLYCKQIGVVLAALLAKNSRNITDLKIWLTKNPVLKLSLPIAGLAHTPLVVRVPPRPPVVAADGATLIAAYATEAFANFLGTTPATGINQQNQQIIADSIVECIRECTRFQALLVAVNAASAGGVLNVAGLTAGFNAAVADDLTSSRARYLEHLLLAVNRPTVLEMDNYNVIKIAGDFYNLRVSEIDQRIKHEVEVTVQANTAGDAVMEAPTGNALVTTVFNQGFDNDRDKLITAMPKRLTHTLFAECEGIYKTGGLGNHPTVRIMQYKGKEYVCPIQTRGNDVNKPIPQQVPDVNLSIVGKQAVNINAVAAPDQYRIREVVGGIPGPNPQPLKGRFLWFMGRRELQQCTTDATDSLNMSQLPLNYISYGKEAGHGDWQSMPNYATLWMILLTANTKNVTPQSEGAYVYSEQQSGIKCFTFQSILVGRDKFVVPKSDSNCMLPSNWELFATWPSGKLLYHNNTTGDLQVNPPDKSYWKQWSGANYIHSYMAEIGYQDAKAKYIAASKAQNSTLSPIEQDELFQRGAHDALMNYVGSLTSFRRRPGTGGSGNNNKKRYNKKTMMSILKTAKRRYFTRRNTTKQ